MVRPVRPARPDAPPRARRWAGPPPLLVLVTVVGFAVAPLVDREPEVAPRPATAVHVSSVPDAPETTAPEPTGPDATEVSRPEATDPRETAPQVRDREEPDPARPRVSPRAPVRVGVASMTLDRSLTPAQAADDARRLVDRPGLDIVGWREVDRLGALRALPGWGTRRLLAGEGGPSLAVSWRRAQFAVVAAGRLGDRPVATVTLRHRDSGRLVTVVDAGAPQPLDDLGRRASARWAVGTAGDVGSRAGDPRRIGDPARGQAVASYLVLGSDLVPTFRPEGRRVAVVYVDRDAHREGRLRFAGRWVVRGFAGDHDALVARLVLS